MADPGVSEITAFVMKDIPRIVSVDPQEGYRLRVRFTDDSVRIYDVSPLLDRPMFSALRDPELFRSVRIEPGGYAVSWNAELDISEYELWRHGVPVAEDVARYRNRVACTSR